ncbi:MAG: hypothetical protein DCF27_03830 [Lysobacteraceae bacterium]|nr:MAG: hypothetical protein DCF27_03830 [Xanthomonadaceae bacterium]
MTDATMLSPLQGGERIDALDVLRGFALLGILLMNIEGMVGPLNGALTGLDPALTGADRWADALIYFFVQGKFYPLFSLLFGMGFAVMMQRAAQAGRPFVRLYLRRVLALLAIGVAHALLVWSGDILTTYALVALLLLLFFRDTPQSRLPKWAIAFMLLPLVLMLLSGLLMQVAELNPESAAEFTAMDSASTQEMAAMLEAQRQAQGVGTYVQSVVQRGKDLAMMLSYLVFYGWQLLGLFLLGGWFVRSGAIARPLEHAALHARLRWIALPLGMVMMAASMALAPSVDMGMPSLVESLAMALSMAGGVLMCLGYLAWIVRGLQSASVGPRLHQLAPAGRMALTNYLAQSVICTFIFSGYGLGYFEQLPRAWQVPFVLGFYALQVIASHAWLARFRFGPMEWLWRAATYLQLPPMRRG